MLVYSYKHKSRASWCGYTERPVDSGQLASCDVIRAGLIVPACFSSELLSPELRNLTAPYCQKTAQQDTFLVFIRTNEILHSLADGVGLLAAVAFVLLSWGHFIFGIIVDLTAQILLEEN